MNAQIRALVFMAGGKPRPHDDLLPFPRESIAIDPAAQRYRRPLAEIAKLFETKQMVGRSQFNTLMSRFGLSVVRDLHLD